MLRRANLSSADASALLLAQVPSQLSARHSTLHSWQSCWPRCSCWWPPPFCFCSRYSLTMKVTLPEPLAELLLLMMLLLFIYSFCFVHHTIQSKGTSPQTLHFFVLLTTFCGNNTGNRSIIAAVIVLSLQWSFYSFFCHSTTRKRQLKINIHCIQCVFDNCWLLPNS